MDTKKEEKEREKLLRKFAKACILHCSGPEKDKNCPLFNKQKCLIMQVWDDPQNKKGQAR